MSDLKYLTKDNSSVYNKPKIYFCCHPNDLEQYLPSVARELFKHVDCSLWYGSTDAERDGEYLSRLQDMRLFVIPVTSKFLETDNYALGLEFAFADQNHIPILPIMQESGLVGLFNRKCGDIQFLDKNDRDPTALSFDKKLGDFLSSVILSEELVKKVQDAFDAYIFLSYRKKDRAFAQELMRLIHKNEFCRDVAIWYDEFLIPGENFNDAIEAAIQKSDLFVLTVTPNLVNENNYIAMREYPFARNEGKEIIPTEMIPTDREKLDEMFDGLPECTDAKDAQKLSDALLRAIKNSAIAKRNDSPEHNYFIGLAYLSGIDVEVDRDRGISLIKSAARDGLPEAMLKLIDIYLYGEGVARNRTQALKWSKKLAKTRKTIYSSDKTYENADKYLYSLRYYISSLPDHLRTRGLRILIRAAKKTAKEVQNELLMKYLFVYLPALSVKRKKRDLPQLEALAEKYGDYDLIEALCWTYNMLADHYDEKGEFDLAVTFYRKAVDTAYRAKDKNIGGETDRDIDLLLSELCSLGITRDADKCTIILNELKALMDKHRDDICAQYYAEAAQNLAGNLFSDHKYDAAAEHAKSAWIIQDELAEKYPTDILDEEYNTIWLLYKIYRRTKADTEAERYYREAVRVLDKIESYANNSDDRVDIARRFILLIEPADKDEAEVFCRRASDNLLLADVSLDRYCRYELRKIAEMHENLGYTLGIEDHFLKAIEIHKYLLKLGKVRSELEALAMCYRELGKIAEDDEKKEEYRVWAEKYARQSNNIAHRIYYRLKKR